MSKRSILVSLGLVGMVITVIGALRKILHYPQAEIFLIIGMVAFGFFWMATIWEIANKKFRYHFNKSFWLFAVLTIPAIASFIYHFKQKY